jgi:hypothetical protein
MVQLYCSEGGVTLGKARDRDKDRVDRILLFLRENSIVSSVIVFAIIVGGIAYFAESVIGLKEAYEEVSDWIVPRNAPGESNERPVDGQGQADPNQAKSESTDQNNPSSSRLTSPVDSGSSRVHGTAAHDSAGRDTSDTLPLKLYRVRLRSQPEGAGVSIDGSSTQIVTDASYQLPAGTYLVVFVKEGFKPSEKTLVVPDQDEVIVILERE